MNIKCANISVILNSEQESIFRTIQRYFKQDVLKNKFDNIVIQFDDNSIYDANKEYIDDKKYEVGHCERHLGFSYFKTTEGEKLYLKLYDGKDVKYTIMPHEKISGKKFQPSFFNIVYVDIREKNQFEMVKLLSNKGNPIYVVAYNDTLFDKSDIIYLVNYVLKYNDVLI